MVCRPYQVILCLNINYSTHSQCLKIAMRQKSMKKSLNKHWKCIALLASFASLLVSSNKANSKQNCDPASLPGYVRWLCGHPSALHFS